MLANYDKLEQVEMEQARRWRINNGWGLTIYILMAFEIFNAYMV
jgi:hypothetical protein